MKKRKKRKEKALDGQTKEITAEEKFKKRKEREQERMYGECLKGRVSEREEEKTFE